MKKTLDLKIFLAVLVLSVALTQPLYADDASALYEFEEGELISANVFNDFFGYIQNSKSSIDSSGLVGIWSMVNFVANANYAYSSSDSLDSDNLYAYKTIDVTFSSDGDGTYSWSSLNYNPFDRSTEARHAGYTSYSGSYKVFNNVLFANYSAHSDWGTVVCVIHTVSPIKMLIFNAQNNGNAGESVFMVCDRVDIPPLKPTHLKAKSQGVAVTLTWRDNSSNETGFKVFRRKQGEKVWTELATLVSDTTVYEEIVLPMGKYWYRVRSTNVYGDSYGSNVAKATIK